MANYPALRLQGEEAWQVCSPETAPNFGKVAFFFARRLQQDALIPIGLMIAKKATVLPDGFLPPVPTPDAKPQWLSIQDADGRWHWPEGRIDGSRLVVSAEGVEKPVAVRYAYTTQPLGHLLYNTDGMPVGPFSTCGY